MFTIVGWGLLILAVILILILGGLWYGIRRMSLTGSIEEEVE